MPQRDTVLRRRPCSRTVFNLSVNDRALHLAVHLAPRKRRILALGDKLRGINRPLFGKIDDGQIGGRADGDRAALQTEDMRGVCAHLCGKLRKAERAAPDELRIREREGRFQSADPERRKRVFHVLIVEVMRGVVGDDAVERAVLQSFDDGEPVLLLADGRVDFGVRIEGGNHLVGEREIVRAGLRRDLYAARLCLADELHAAVCGDVADMHGQRQALGKADLAGDDNVFRGADTPFQPRQRGVIPLVDDAAIHERAVLAVAQAFQPEVGGILHGERHDLGGGNAPAVLRDRDRARRLHRADGGEVVPLLPLGDRADGMHLAEVHLFRAIFDIGHDNLVIGDGLGVGHTADLRESALDGGAAAAQNILFLLEPRLAQMHVHIDQPGEYGQPRAVDALALDMGRNLGNFALFNADVRFLYAAL